MVAATQNSFYIAFSRGEACLSLGPLVAPSVSDAFGHVFSHAFAFRPTKSDICRVDGHVYPIFAPIPNFIQIGWKLRKLKILTFGQFWLVGLVGQKWSQPLQTFNCRLKGYKWHLYQVWTQLDGTFSDSDLGLFIQLAGNQSVMKKQL